MEIFLFIFFVESIQILDNFGVQFFIQNMFKQFVSYTQIEFSHFQGVKGPESVDMSTLAVGILLLIDKMGAPSTMSTTRPSKLSTVVVRNQ